MALPCLFKFSGKPLATNRDTSGNSIDDTCEGGDSNGYSVKNSSSSKKVVPTFKKNQLLEQVMELQQHAAMVETQLQLLGANVHARESYCSYSPDICSRRGNKDADDKNEWRLVLSRRADGGLRLETPIRNLSEMAQFLNQTWKYFVIDPKTPYFLPYTTQPERYMPVTNRMLQAERILRGIIGQVRNMTTTASSPTSISTLRRRRSFFSSQETQVMASFNCKMVDIYFNCQGFLSPVFVRSYYVHYLKSHPHSMLTNAMVAVVLCGQCRHVQNAQDTLPFSRQALAEIYREKARHQLQDALFDNDEDEQPSVEKMATMWMIAQCLLVKLQTSEARIYITTAWRMAIQLKDSYSDTLQQLNYPNLADKLDPVTVAKAETWRRIFYIIRYLEISMYIAYDGLVDFSAIIFHSSIGRPTVLPWEREDPVLCNAVQIYQYLITLSVLPSGCDGSRPEELVLHRLYSGALEAVSCADLEFIEKRLIEFWHQIPREYWLSDAPISYVDPERVRRCSDPHVLYLNEMYFLFWLNFQSRLMQTPAKADLTGASFGRLDAERALLIVSIACDAVTRIMEALLRCLPCAIEAHWLTVVLDVLMLLKDAADPGLQMRAQSNFQTAFWVLNNSIGSYADSDALRQMFPSPNDAKSLSSSAGASVYSGMCGSGCASTSPGDSSIASPDTAMIVDGNSNDSGLFGCDLPGCSSSSPPCSPVMSSTYFGELKRKLQIYFSDIPMQ